MKTINQVRSEAIERNRAFSEVINLRDAISDARKRLASIEADLAARPRQPTDNRDRIRTHIADLESSLAEAEAWCREINPDQLLEYDTKIAAAEEAARVAREAEEAASAIARREAATNAEAARKAQFAARKRQREETIEYR
ncbi:cob(I)alamin adenosyltransferase [Nitrobacter vulgaris]|uniref:hypothetical protein n=1 Tax=Nitrobacter vulgaris TaxID=29421 RepID=UPI0028672072|nr:hypothetical protein [Nitrobacter vulgaris]MDR6305937.1 cob(I)alamin adenosyltransferase [Nitrobacter vulgaris]